VLAGMAHRVPDVRGQIIEVASATSSSGAKHPYARLLLRAFADTASAANAGGHPRHGAAAVAGLHAAASRPACDLRFRCVQKSHPPLSSPACSAVRCLLYRVAQTCPRGGR